MTVRVLLADDHTLVRAGLRALVSGLPDVAVVGEASHGREAVEFALRLKPDIVLMDINMPELNGLTAAERICRALPRTRVIMLSMLGNDSYVEHALRLGAAGYLLKDADAVELALAIRAVADGHTYLSPAVARHATVLAKRGLTPGPALTARQREVLQLIAEGRTTKEIAQRLDLSARTVETHRTQIMERLKIRDVAGLVRYAIREGIIRADR
jgi:DNA-binding NarL/FixJ family response regulator